MGGCLNAAPDPFTIWAFTSAHRVGVTTIGRASCIHPVHRSPNGWVTTWNASIRLNLTAGYYRWPKTTAFASWREKLPPDFRLCVKAPRWMTHYGNLSNAPRWMDRIKEGWHELGDKRAILLVQLSPRFECNYDRLAQFLDLLPGLDADSSGVSSPKLASGRYF